MEILSFSFNTVFVIGNSEFDSWEKSWQKPERKKKNTPFRILYFYFSFSWNNYMTLNIVSFPPESHWRCPTCPIHETIAIFFASQEGCCLATLRCFQDIFQDNFNRTEKTQKRLYRSLKNPLTVSTTLLKITKKTKSDIVTIAVTLKAIVLSILGRRYGLLSLQKCKKHYQYLRRCSYFDIQFVCSQHLFFPPLHFVSAQSVCQDCSSHPQMNVRTFFSRLDSLIQKVHCFSFVTRKNCRFN